MQQDVQPIINTLLNLEHSVLRADSLREAGYVIVNQTKQLAGYTQAALLRGEGSHEYRVYSLSNLGDVDRTSPFSFWIERLAKEIRCEDKAAETHQITKNDVSYDLAEDWSSYSSTYILWVPLFAGWRGQQGVLVIAREEAFGEQEIKNLSHISKIYGFALAADPHQYWWSRLKRSVSARIKKIALVLLLLSLFPVRLTVMAPAEIGAKSAFVVSAPFDGVVSKVEVFPNQEISVGDLLVQLEGEDYQATQNVRKQAVQVAEANLHRAVQAGFEDAESRSEVASLKAELDLKKMELVQAELKNKNTSILAERSGVAVIEDPIAWQGRPVKVGERILQIANPEEVEVLAFVSVKDAIALEPGRNVRVFLDTAPLSPIHATIKYSAYEPVRTEEDVPAYRIVAEINKGEIYPRIGLRGTAKVEGDYVSLMYYLFRRPITALRQWVGW